MRMYACVHYKKRKATLRSYQNKDCDDDEIEDKNRRKLITVNHLRTLYVEYGKLCAPLAYGFSVAVHYLNFLTGKKL